MTSYISAERGDLEKAVAIVEGFCNSDSLRQQLVGAPSVEHVRDTLQDALRRHNQPGNNITRNAVVTKMNDQSVYRRVSVLVRDFTG